MVKKFYLEGDLKAEGSYLFLLVVSNLSRANNHQKVTLILHSNDFKRLKQRGIKAYPNKWMYLSFLRNNQKQIRFGWTISRKIGSSVIRNRLKRWYRQYFRENLQKYSELCIDVNIILRPCGKIFYKKIRYDELIEPLEKGLQLIRKIKSIPE